MQMPAFTPHNIFKVVFRVKPISDHCFLAIVSIRINEMLSSCGVKETNNNNNNNKQAAEEAQVCAHSPKIERAEEEIPIRNCRKYCAGQTSHLG